MANSRSLTVNESSTSENATANSYFNYYRDEFL